MDLQGLIAKLGMFWPEGDPGKLRQSATAYRRCASDLGAAQAACQSATGLVQSHDQGPPIDAFAAWAARWQSNPGYFPATIATCNQLADACDAYAQRIDDAHARIIELATAAAAALAVGLALTVFTFGGSDAAAGVTVAGLVAASLAEGTALSAAAAGIVVAVGVGALEGMVFDGVVQLEATAVFHDQKGFNWGEFGTSALFGAVTGGLGAGAGMGLARVGTRLLPTLADASPTVARTFTTLGRIPAPLREGAAGLLTGTGISAGFDLATTGHLNPDDLLVGGLSGLAGGLAAGGRGRGLPRTPVDTTEPSTVTIRFEDGFSRTGFNKKAAALVQLGDEGLLYKAPNPVARDPQLTRNYKADLIRRIYNQYGARNPDFAAAARLRVLTQLDADHIHDLQLGGPDTRANLWLLDSTTNRVMGTRQIWPQIRPLPDNTPIRIVVDRGPTNVP